MPTGSPSCRDANQRGDSKSADVMVADVVRPELTTVPFRQERMSSPHRAEQARQSWGIYDRPGARFCEAMRLHCAWVALMLLDWQGSDISFHRRVTRGHRPKLLPASMSQPSNEPDHESDALGDSFWILCSCGDKQGRQVERTLQGKMLFSWGTGLLRRTKRRMRMW